MSRDDWKYYDDEMWDEEEREEEEKKKPVECRRCTRFNEPGALYCSWCGRPLGKE